MMSRYMIRFFIGDSPLNRNDNFHSRKAAAVHMNKHAEESLPPKHGSMKLSDFQDGALKPQRQ